MEQYKIEKLNLNNENEITQVNNLVEEAFKNIEHSDHDEQNLIKRLRNEQLYNNDFEIIIKQQNNNKDQIIGYALLSEIQIVDQENEIKALCLGPIAVKLEFQNQGIGKLLMKEIENVATQHKYPAISILGSPSYYSRFGYVPSINFNIKSTFEVPDEYYMIKQLFENSLSNIKNGKIKYQNSFNI